MKATNRTAKKSDAAPTVKKTLGARPKSFRMDIASGMLESLGLNMYTSIGKSLSEFVANAYDTNASMVKITIPFGTIEKERAH